MVCHEFMRSWGIGERSALIHLAVWWRHIAS
jgi:hypothetical protein